MANLKYSDKHNMVAFLKKPNESVGFTEVVDFLKGTSLRYALTHNPTIYDSLVKQFWQTATVRTLANRTQQLVASIDSKEYTITEASIRSKLQLADATGIYNLSDADIYAGLATLGPKSGGWDQFGSTIATALICLASNRAYNFSKMIFDGMVHNLERDFVPLLPTMLVGAAVDQGNTSGSAEDSVQLKQLMILVPKLVNRIGSLEKELKETKQTLGNALLTLVKKGRIIQDIDDDPLVSLVRESMKEKLADFVTPIKASGEAQEEEIIPIILEVAKTLSKVSSQGVSKAKSSDKGKRYRRRARSMAKNINTGLDAKDEIDTGRVEINTGIEDVNTGSTKVDTDRTSMSTSSIILSPKKGQREGKAQMVEEDIQ
ncbi:hypothetical protein Tco_1512666, partial [Tanacetum coccineum]